MKKYKVIDIIGSFGLFLDEEIEAENIIEAREQIMDEIIDNIGNYIDIELERIEDEDE